MLGAEITFISAMKQSISGMEMKFLHPKDALFAVSTTTWNKVEYNWFMNIFLFNFNMCKLNEKQLLPTSLVVQLSLGWRMWERARGVWQSSSLCLVFPNFCPNLIPLTLTWCWWPNYCTCKWFMTEPQLCETQSKVSSASKCLLLDLL